MVALYNFDIAQFQNYMPIWISHNIVTESQCCISYNIYCTSSLKTELMPCPSTGCEHICTDCRVHSGVPKITTCFWPHLTQRWWLSCAVQASSIFLDHKIIKHHWKFDHGSLNFPHLGGIQQSAVCLFTRNSLSWGRGNSLVGCCGMYIAQYWYVHQVTAVVYITITSSTHNHHVTFDLCSLGEYKSLWGLKVV